MESDINTNSIVCDASKSCIYEQIKPPLVSEHAFPLTGFVCMAAHSYWTSKKLLTPPHELLKRKLFSYGTGSKTLKWINAFLCYRQQRVVVNGVKSVWAPVVSGVPQGTVFGPLLFSLHINDITADIECEIRLFADDCVCYREIKDKEDTLKLQRDIDRLGNWARKWGMRFQPVKCNMMQLTRKHLNKIQASYIP